MSNNLVVWTTGKKISYAYWKEKCEEGLNNQVATVFQKSSGAADQGQKKGVTYPIMFDSVLYDTYAL